MVALSSLAVQVAVVGTIVIATRWLLGAAGTQTPRARGGTLVYGIKWQMRVAGISIASLMVGVLVAFRDDPDRMSLLVFVPVVLVGVWLATGSVTTDDTGLTKKTFWLAQSVSWNEITAIRFYPKQQYIQVRANSRELTVDLRFVAVKQLLDEIVKRTKIEPTLK